MRLALLCLALLAGCSNDPPSAQEIGNDVGSILDQQAIEAGILPDLEQIEFSGRFETRNELGTDKFCAISSGARQFKIGVLAVFGPQSKCEGQGVATTGKNSIRITLRGKGSCSFDAAYDGVELRFPELIESGCAAYCTDRASLSGTHYFMIQPGAENARRTLGRDIERLCDR